MTLVIRKLEPEDVDAVRAVSQSVWEHDYAPESFQRWLDDPNWHPIGVFKDGLLVSFAALQQVPETDYAWVKALRTHSNYHRQGFGVMAVEKTLDIARELGIREVRYATSSRNEASHELAKKLGFILADEVGYFRLEAPFPPRPKSSPAFVPLKVDAKRQFEAIQTYDDLVTTSSIPVAWDFENKDLKGLERIHERNESYQIIGDSGEVLTLYFRRTLERDGDLIVTHSVFSRDRSTFVDTMSRLIEEAEDMNAQRAVFFLGPNATEWSSMLMLVPAEYRDRRFILLKRILE